ncbi:MAG: AMP-binding protein [Jiangellales bacterium]
MSGPSAHNVADLLTRAAAQHGDRPALVTQDATQTWAQVDATTSRVASGLQQRGVSLGSRVVLVLPTSAEFVTAYLGVLRAGGVAVPLSTEYTPGELARLIGRTEATVVIAGGSSLAAVRQAVAGIADALVDPPDDLAGRSVPLLVVTGTALPEETAYTDLETFDGVPTPHERGGEDAAVMLFTSGSSADPRAALLSHRALVSNLDQLMALEPTPLGADDVMLAVLPMFHVYGLNTVLGEALATGACLVLRERFDLDETLALIVRHGVTIVPAAPPMLLALSEADGLEVALAGVRYIVSGAAALSATLQEELTARTGVTIHQGYGLTEAAPVVTTTLASTPKPGSVGRPLPGSQIMLVDDDGEPVHEGDPGEVVVRGPNLFSGYWPGDVEGPNPEGWWPTGDVAFVDEDGDLHLADRIKDIVIVNGFNVYPREVEEALVEHPAIAAAAVVSVPDRRTGEAVKAVVVAADGHELSVEDVTDHCRDRLARFKRPTQIEIADELPRTSIGKVARGRLRDAAAREADKKLAGLT